MPRATRRSLQRLAIIVAAGALWSLGRYRHGDPVVGWSRWDTLSGDGVAALDAGDLARADPLLSDALEEAERTGTPHNVAVSAHNLAGLRLRQKRFAEAEPLLRRAIALVERERPPDEAYLARLTNDLALACLSLGRQQEALDVMDRSVELSRRALGPSDPATVRRMQQRAGILLAAGRVPDAIRAATRAAGPPAVH